MSGGKTQREKDLEGDRIIPRSNKKALEVNLSKAGISRDPGRETSVIKVTRLKCNLVTSWPRREDTKNRKPVEKKPSQAGWCVGGDLNRSHDHSTNVAETSGSHLSGLFCAARLHLDL